VPFNEFGHEAAEVFYSSKKEEVRYTKATIWE